MKGIVIAPLLIWAASVYGITGILVVTLSATLVIDFAFFTWRLHKLGYLQTSLLRDLFSKWMIIVPASLLLCWVSRFVTERWLPSNLNLYKVIVAGSLFTSGFLILVITADALVRDMVKQFADRFILRPYNKIVGNFSA